MFQMHSADISNQKNANMVVNEIVRKRCTIGGTYQHV